MYVIWTLFFFNLRGRCVLRPERPHLLRGARDEKPFVDAWVDWSGLQVLSSRYVDAVRVDSVGRLGDLGVGAADG
jgi:hypothetical protein